MPGLCVPGLNGMALEKRLREKHVVLPGLSITFANRIAQWFLSSLLQELFLGKKSEGDHVLQASSLPQMCCACGTARSRGCCTRVGGRVMTWMARIHGPFSSLRAYTNNTSLPTGKAYHPPHVALQTVEALWRNLLLFPHSLSSPPFFVPVSTLLWLGRIVFPWKLHAQGHTNKLGALAKGEGLQSSFP